MYGIIINDAKFVEHVILNNFLKMNDIWVKTSV